MSDEMIFFNHNVGDGLHYINHNQQVLPGGLVQFGETSHICALLNAETILSRNLVGFETIEELWNSVYPRDPMSMDDAAYIFFAAIDYTNDFDPTSLDNISSTIDDLIAVGYPELAERFRQVLREHGFNLPD